MRKNWFYILLSLAEQERHGSAIMRDVLELTGGELRLWPVTLYGSLDELQERGWIRPLDEPRERPEGESERKRYFRITAQGRRALTEEVRRLDAVAEVAHRRLGRVGEA